MPRVSAATKKMVEDAILQSKPIKSYCQSNAIIGNDVDLVTLVASMSSRERQTLKAIIATFGG